MKKLMVNFFFPYDYDMDKQNYLEGNVARISISVHGRQIIIWVSLMLRKIQFMSIVLLLKKLNKIKF